jgi:hypothetical protein
LSLNLCDIRAIKINNKNIIKKAVFVEIFPNAIGRYFLVMCFLSFFKSIISFKIYVDDVSNPKAKKPKNKFSIISGESGS